MTETHNHLVLKKIAKNKLEQQGFEKIFYEYPIKINGHKFRIDVVGFSKKHGKVAIECGIVNGDIDKIKELLSYFDEVVHLPYLGGFSSNFASKRIIFRLTEQQNNRLKKIYTKYEKYKTISELIRHIMDIGLDELEDKK